MINYTRQKGMGLLSVLGLLIAAGMVVLVAFKMAPAYYDNRLVVTALRNLDRGGEDVANMSKGEIRQKMTAFYTVNGVRGEPREHLEVERKADRTLVKVEYEIREHLFGNVSIVMSFSNILDSSNPSDCC